MAAIAQHSRFAASPAAASASLQSSDFCSASGAFRPSSRSVSWVGCVCSRARMGGSRGGWRRGISRGWGSARASLQPPPEAGTEQEQSDGAAAAQGDRSPATSSKKNELNEAVRRTAATFAPRASTPSRNPAPPGSTLYKVFEAQAYIAMVVGGALSFNLLFPSDQPDIWRLMGMWSVWMFTVPSLRARDCSKKEKEALNYLFIAIPLINVTLPLVWRSFPAVWSTDVLAFLAIYAWKMEWFSDANKVKDS